jgi:hypothetical protein
LRLGLVQVFVGRHQFEPASVFPAHALHVRARAVELGQRGAPAETVLQGLVVLGGAVGVEGLQEVDQRQVVVDEAAVGQFEAAGFHLARECGEFAVGRAGLGQGLGLVQEGVVVADEVEDDELLLPLRPAQPAPELLQEQDLRLGGAQHQDGVDGGQVDALAEQVDREDDLQAAVGEALQRVAAAEARAAVHGGGRDAFALELVGHVLGVADRHAEGQRALLGAAAPLFQRVPGAGEGGQFVRELFRVEAAVAPGDLAVVDRLVPDAVVVERREQPGLDPGEQVAGEHEVVVAQGQDVGLVGAVRGGGEAEQEARFEVAEQAPVGGCGGVVEFVDHDVIEVVRREAPQVRALAERLHRRAEHVDLRVARLAHVEADPSLGADACEGTGGLAQDLFAVGDEQHALAAHVFGVEGGEPGLAETGGEHDEAAPVAVAPGGSECGEGFGLDRVGSGGGSVSWLPGAIARGGGTRRFS